MSNEPLRDSLDLLRAEINRGDLSGEESRARLNSLISDLERKLENPEDAAHHETLVSNVQDSIGHFELEHPRATTILNQIMTALGNIGI